MGGLLALGGWRARHSLPAQASATLPLAALRRREIDVARCVCRDMTDKEIARELAIALPSVRTYLQRLFDKLGVHRRAGLAQLADRLH